MADDSRASFTNPYQSTTGSNLWKDWSAPEDSTDPEVQAAMNDPNRAWKAVLAPAAAYAGGLGELAGAAGLGSKAASAIGEYVPQSVKNAWEALRLKNMQTIPLGRDSSGRMMASGATNNALRPVTAAGTLATAAALKAPSGNEQANAAGAPADAPLPPRRPSSVSSSAENIAQKRAAQVRNAVTQTAPLPPKRSDYFPSSAKQKVDYQSNNQPASPAEGRINWGDSDSAADFFRASKALQANPEAVGVGSSADTGMASGGTVDRAMKVAKQKATPCHSGIINMAVGGRTDHIPMNVLEGSYVLPADIVSGLGEGNTLAGTKIIDQMFGSGPFGVKTPTFRASPHIPSPNYQYRPTSPYEPPQFHARGGRTNAKRPVPIIAAGGEYVVHPDVVARLGDGDMDKGHEYLDNFVKYVRQETAKTLNKLPPPRKN